MFADATIAVPNIQAGKVTALGTSAARQTTLLPGVPPIASVVAGYDWQAWQGIVAPAGTPRDIVARLSTELQKIQAAPEFKEQLIKFGMEPFAPHTPGAVRRDHRCRAAAVGEGDQGFRREGRLTMAPDRDDQSRHRRPHALPDRGMVRAAAAARRTALHA